MHTSDDIVKEIVRKIVKVHSQFKSLAPQNSNYISNERGKLVNYIYVDGKKVSSNTNNLFNNVGLREIPLGDGVSNTYEIYVSGGAVPYYENVVKKQTLEVARHFGRSEYGNKRYPTSKIILKDNRNFEYYKKGYVYVENLLKEYDGKRYRVSDIIGGK